MGHGPATLACTDSLCIVTEMSEIVLSTAVNECTTMKDCLSCSNFMFHVENTSRQVKNQD